MNIRSLLALLLLASSVFVGCAQVRNFPLQTDLPDTSMLGKSNLRVALYIPDSTRNYRVATRIPSVCGFGAEYAPNRFGALFAETLEGTLRQVFQEVTPISQPVALGYDLIIQAEFREFVYKLNCMADPTGYNILKGFFHAVDGQGVEIWQSRITESTMKHPGGLLHKDAIPAMYTAFIGKWTEELLAAPPIQQLAASRK
jgi:hypothetical protein